VNLAGIDRVAVIIVIVVPAARIIGGKNNVRTGRAGVSKITNVALTPVISGSRERSKLYGATRRMARARQHTHTHTHTCARVLLLHVSARVDRRRVVPIAITALMMTRGDILGDDHDPRLPRPLW